MDTALVPAPLVAEAARVASRGSAPRAARSRMARSGRRARLGGRRPGAPRGSAAARGAVEGHYLALLGPGGPASPREAAYVGLGDPGRTLAELRAFYDAFAYRRAPKTRRITSRSRRASSRTSG